MIFLPIESKIISFFFTKGCQAVSATEYESREKQNTPTWMFLPICGGSVLKDGETIICNLNKEAR